MIRQVNIALCSPAKDNYSETFIQAHKNQLKGRVFYYYGGELPTKLEGGIVINSRRRRIVDILKGYFSLNKFSLAEQALLKSFKKNEIDLVFAEYGITGSALISCCRELNLPLIVHFHGYDAVQRDVLNLNNNYKDLFGFATYIIAVSKEMRQDLKKIGCPKDKLIYNPYGPTDAFQKVKPGFKNKQFIAAGRFVDKKAPYYLILSFIEVLKKEPEAKLFIAGEGKLWNSCKNLIKYFELEGRVILTGVISRELFMDYLENSLAFIQHSIVAGNGDKEGTPVAILEAGAAGLPVISTKHAGIPDVVLDKVTGLLVEEHNIRSMSDCMVELIRNPVLAKEMGENARERITSKFSLDKHINVLNDLIQRSLN